MKYCKNRTSLPYSWEESVAAFWRRYPNSYSRHVLSEDTVFRKIIGDTIYSKRLLIKTSFSLPKWGERFVSQRWSPIVEESFVDRVNKVLVTYTRNISYTKIMTVEERCVYEPDPANPERTLWRREGWVCSKVPGFSFAIQKFGLEKFKQNCQNATKGFLSVLATLSPRPTVAMAMQDPRQSSRNHSTLANPSKADLISLGNARKVIDLGEATFVEEEES